MKYVLPITLAFVGALLAIFAAKHLPSSMTGA